MRVHHLAWCFIAAVPVCLAAPAAFAETFGDCAPVGPLDNFAASAPPETRSYGAMDFRVIDKGIAKNVTKAGRTCAQVYGLQPGATPSSDLEIMKNYAEGLPGLGLAITNTDRQENQEIFATGTKDGTETWVHVSPSNGNAFRVDVVQVEGFKASLAPPGDKDCQPGAAWRQGLRAGAGADELYRL